MTREVAREPLLNGGALRVELRIVEVALLVVPIVICRRIVESLVHLDLVTPTTASDHNRGEEDAEMILLRELLRIVFRRVGGEPVKPQVFRTLSLLVDVERVVRLKRRDAAPCIGGNLTRRRDGQAVLRIEAAIGDDVL